MILARTGPARVALVPRIVSRRALSTTTGVPPPPSIRRVANTATALPARPALDFKAICANADALQRNAELRAMPLVNVHRAADLYRQWGAATQELQRSLATSNRIAAEIKAAVAARSKLQADTPEKVATNASLDSLRTAGLAAKTAAKELAPKAQALEDVMYAEAVHIPNMSYPDVPVGSEDKAELAGLIGVPPLPPTVPGPNPGVAYRDHVQLATDLDLIDLPAGAKVTGSSFYYLKGAAALMELGLAQLAIQAAVRRGFVPVSAPDMVRRRVSAACGFQPRDARQTQNYAVSHPQVAVAVAPDDPDALLLAATAEIPLAGMHASSVIPRKALPLRYVALGRAFRAESGARGADTRGLYRVHQFSKVEMFALTAPTRDAAQDVFDTILDIQREMVEALGLHARVLRMPTEELGASAACKVDVEAWMPGRGGWGEICSASICTDYQSRRLGIRTEPESSDAASSSRPFVYTINGTGAAIPRLIVAVLETHQQQDGSIRVPLALQPFVGTDVLRQ
ncbi:hypothetical protein BC828DRAFT_388017 [Blastocladiella britannica]|nr:hypothetical protein BC828DRAFT_388017 [Blastocladiella britannica]